MKLYSENENYKLYNGNMLDMLEVIEPNTIDSIITDPPYELNFMGKGWDNSGIAFQSDTWGKCYEVLKPGGYLLAFGGSRTFHRIAVAIEDAGFEIRDTIMWLYGSGFPKSMDISKQLDKRNGRNEKEFKELGDYLKEKIIDTDNICAEKIGFSPALVRFWKLGERIPNKETWLKLKSIYDLDDYFDWLIEREEAERKIIGSHKMLSGWNLEENKFVDRDITLPSTDLAKQWQGWGTTLKPSFEPIIVARKPFKGSLVDNVIEYGVGGINIDECRVDFENGETNSSINRYNSTPQRGNNGWQHINRGANFDEDTKKSMQLGRFPANTILTYDENDFEEVCGGFPYTNSGKMKLNSEVKRKGITEDMPVFNSYNCGIDVNKATGLCSFGDSGSASRYFYCAKASKKDRDEGLDEFEEKENNITYGDGFNSSTKLTTPEQIERGEVGNRSLRKNVHPTVKPTELMQYLVRLASPNGAAILDPFNGSGSTGKAVMYENKERNKNYKYIGIELTEEYLPIAKARIEYVCNLEKEQDNQTSIFDFIEE